MANLIAADADAARVVHGIFEWLGFVVAAMVYRRFKRLRPGEGANSPIVGTVLAGGFLGGLVGSKLVAWLQEPEYLVKAIEHPFYLLSGQSILGGILGAWIGIEIAKRTIDLRERTGDDFVWPLCAGIAIGRIGCFLAGLYDGTYGVPSTLPWAVDFGDGVPRHPTQLYEVAFLGVIALALWGVRPMLGARPGLIFRWFALTYVAWRLLVDAIKPVPFAYPGGLSFIQWVCLVALCWIAFDLLRSHRTPRAATT